MQLRQIGGPDRESWPQRPGRHSAAQPLGGGAPSNAARTSTASAPPICAQLPAHRRRAAAVARRSRHPGQRLCFSPRQAQPVGHILPPKAGQPTLPTGRQTVFQMHQRPPARAHPRPAKSRQNPRLRHRRNAMARGQGRPAACASRRPAVRAKASLFRPKALHRPPDCQHPDPHPHRHTRHETERTAGSADSLRECASRHRRQTAPAVRADQAMPPKGSITVPSACA